MLSKQGKTPPQRGRKRDVVAGNFRKHQSINVVCDTYYVMSNSGDDNDHDGQGGQPQGGQGGQGGQPQGGQGGQPQGGQPQGGQPQGGQGGQPQGGQPQGGQPQGGQPPQQGQPPQGQPPQQGQPRGQAQQQGTSVDIPPEVQEWSIYSAILFAIAGGTSGAFALLFYIIEEPVIAPDGPSGIGAGVVGVSGTLTSGIVPIFAAAFLGVALYGRLSMDESTMLKTAAAVGAVGALVTFLLINILTFIGASDVSLEFGGLIINGIVAALLGAGACAGGVWAEQNQAPDRTP